MADDIVQRQDHGAIATLTLNAPASLNALSDAMIAALHGRIRGLAQDHSIRVVVLRGSGKVFCAGHDLKEMQAARAAPDQGRAAFQSLFDRCAAMMLALQALPQTVIAQVHGIATAAGCQLVASCDMAVAETGTRFGVNGVNIGLFCSTPMVALTRKIPRGLAFEMLTTGEFISADRALAAGLVNRVTDADTLPDVTMALAGTVAAKLGRALRIGKSTFYAQADLPVADAYAYAGAAMVENMLERDTDEGITAFLQKRKPDWAC